MIMEKTKNKNTTYIFLNFKHYTPWKKQMIFIEIFLYSFAKKLIKLFDFCDLPRVTRSNSERV